MNKRTSVREGKSFLRGDLGPGVGYCWPGARVLGPGEGVLGPGAWGKLEPWGTGWTDVYLNGRLLVCLIVSSFEWMDGNSSFLFYRTSSPSAPLPKCLTRRKTRKNDQKNDRLTNETTLPMDMI